MATGVVVVIWRLFLICELLSVLGRGTTEVIRIGAILSSPEEESALRLAVEFVNEEQLMGPDLTLEHVTNHSGVISAFCTMQIACFQASVGIMAYIGPISSTGIQATSPLSRYLQIPQISPTATNPLLGTSTKYPYLVRMVPPDTEQSMALVSLMEAQRWTRFAILTSNTDYGVNGLLRFRTAAARRKWHILSVQHFNARASEPNMTDAIRQLKVIRNTGVRVVVLNCLFVFGIPVLLQAEALGMLTAGWAWVVTDGISGQGHPIPDSLTGLLGTRPSSEQGALWDTMLERWTDADSDLYPGTDEPLQQYSASVMDALLTFAYAVRDMYKDYPHSNISQKPLDCLSESWSHGHTMLHYIKQVRDKGTSSDIEFNSEGSPQYPVYDIVNLHTEGWIKIGQWDPARGLGTGLDRGNMTLPGGQTSVTDYVSQLANKTLRMAILAEKPFIRFTTSKYDPTNIQRGEVEGLNMDFLDELCRLIGFNYTLYLVPDRQYGRKDPDTFQWDGLVGELVRRRADIALAPLTINYPREKDIDFTKPYLDLGMQFIMRVPPVEPMRPFRFLDPFREDVWMMTLLMTFVVGIYVSLLNKLSPYDHHGRFVYRDYAKAEKVADIALAPLTINYPREKDIDFTKPYLDLGMQFIMRVPPVEPMRPFRFLDPFREDVWMMTLLMTFVVGIYVSLLNKLSPYDHHGRFVYRDYAKAEKVLEQNVLKAYTEYKKMTVIKREAMGVFSFSNSVWFSIATLLHQGGEAYPRSCSARLAMLTWLFAIVIIVATYTANLAAFLTASRSKTTIDSIEDLGTQTKVKYGTVRSSAPRQFFEDSNVTLYKDMLLYMTQQDTYVNQTEMGIIKARQGGYAFIFDSAVLDYVVESRPCGTLRSVGRLFGKIGYGLGLQKSSPYKTELSYWILKLREEGYMDQLVHKWYREKGECSQNSKDSTEHDKAIEAAGGKLGISQMLGVFIIVLGGICLSVVILGLEWVVAVHSAVDKKDTMRPSTFSQSFRQRKAALLADLKDEALNYLSRKPEDPNPRPTHGISRSLGNNNSNHLKNRHDNSTHHSVIPDHDVIMTPYTIPEDDIIMPPYVISEDDVILSLAGSISRRRRCELGEVDEMYTVTSLGHSIPRYHGATDDFDANHIYRNPAFQSDSIDDGVIDKDGSTPDGFDMSTPGTTIDNYPGRHSPRSQSPRLIRNV